MSTLAFAAFPQEAKSMSKDDVVQLDGAGARALAVAYDAYREKLPDAKIESYTVHVHRAADGVIQVVFAPKPVAGEKPTLGGRTAQGRELNVWVSTDDYTVDRVSFAR